MFSFVFCFFVHFFFIFFYFSNCCNDERDASSGGRGGVRWWTPSLLFTVHALVISISFRWTFSFRSSTDLYMSHICGFFLFFLSHVSGLFSSFSMCHLFTCIMCHGIHPHHPMDISKRCVIRCPIYSL